MQRKDLSAEGIYSNIRRCFGKVEDKRRGAVEYALEDVLMSALAMFAVKSPSLLDFEDQFYGVESIKKNIQNLFGVQKVASDTSVRRILDEVAPEDLEAPFKKLSSCLQRGKVLESYACFDGHIMISVDGTGYYSSHSVGCEQCCIKEHRDGTKTYYHNMLAAVICHPDVKQVFPITRPEAITKEDGARKNGSEQGASLRCLKRIRREHPHMKFIVLEDSLHSKGPHIMALKELGMSFILTAKPGDHKKLFEFMELMKNDGLKTFECHSSDGKYQYRFRYYNGAPLSDTHMDLSVNFLEFWQKDVKTGKTAFHSSWVTDIELKPENLVEVMRGGRTRWRIENETFNVIKNQGYHFEHNFGHGYKNLSVVMATLMILAFAADQVQEACCGLFQAALKSSIRKCYFWAKLRNRFEQVVFLNWEQLWGVFSGKFKIEATLVDSS